MRNRLLVAGVIGISSLQVVQAGEALATAESIRNAVKQHGATFALHDLYENEKAFGYVMDRIAEGKPDWLDVAAGLAPAADAHPGEELASALAMALPNAPVAVLSRSFAPITLEFICGGPGSIEDDAGYRAAVVRSLESVAKVKNPKLIESRDSCLRMLKEALVAIAPRESGE